jgi:hypothetical protein
MMQTFIVQFVRKDKDDLAYAVNYVAYAGCASNFLQQRSKATDASPQDARSRRRG